MQWALSLISVSEHYQKSKAQFKLGQTSVGQSNLNSPFVFSEYGLFWFRLTFNSQN